MSFNGGRLGKEGCRAVKAFLAGEVFVGRTYKSCFVHGRWTMLLTLQVHGNQVAARYLPDAIDEVIRAKLCEDTNIEDVTDEISYSWAGWVTPLTASVLGKLDIRAHIDRRVGYMLGRPTEPHTWYTRSELERMPIPTKRARQAHADHLQQEMFE